MIENILMFFGVVFITQKVFAFLKWLYIIGKQQNEKNNFRIYTRNLPKEDEEKIHLRGFPKIPEGEPVRIYSTRRSVN